MGWMLILTINYAFSIAMDLIAFESDSTQFPNELIFNRNLNLN